MNFNFDCSNTRYENNGYKKRALEPCNRFIPVLGHKINIDVEKPTTPYQEILYKTLFEGRDIENSILSIHPTTYSNTLTLKKNEDWFIPNKKALFVKSLDGFSFDDAKNPITWIRTNQFILTYQNKCMRLTGSEVKDFTFYKDKQKVQYQSIINAVHSDIGSDTMAVSRNGSYRIYDLHNGEMTFHPGLKSTKTVNKVHLMDQSCSFITGSAFCIQDLRSKKITTTFKCDSTKNWTSFDYTSRGNHIALGNDQGDFLVYDKRQDKPRGEVNLGSGINAVKWEPQESCRVAAAKVDGSISIYSLNESFKPIAEIQTESPALTLMWNAKNCLVSGHADLNLEGENSIIKVWDTRSMLLKASLDNFGGAKYMTPSLNGERFAVIGDNLSVFETPKPEIISKDQNLKRKACSELDNYPTIR